MLIEDARICESLRKIVAGLTADAVLQEDLMQESLIRLWRLEIERPGRTRSWYLQNCRYHLQHWLAAGRSVDSLKRAHGDNHVTIDGVGDELPADWYHTNGELIELVSARDIVSTLGTHLRPRERGVLTGLADGMVLRDVAVKVKLSYPTALKYRRKIAALTIKLGIASPPGQQKADHQDHRVNGFGYPYAFEQTNWSRKPQATAKNLACKPSNRVPRSRTDVSERFQPGERIEQRRRQPSNAVTA
jgi:hypothetical protein